MDIYEFDIWDFEKGIILAKSHEEAVKIFKTRFPDVPVLNTDTDEYDSGVCVIRYVMETDGEQRLATFL